MSGALDMAKTFPSALEQWGDVAAAEIVSRRASADDNGKTRFWRAGHRVYLLGLQLAAVGP